MFPMLPVLLQTADPGTVDWVQLILRWLHLVFGVLWIGLLYFFNLVNVPFMKEIDASTKGTVVPRLLPRALWYFRWAAVATVVAGFLYWEMYIILPDVRNAAVNGVADPNHGLVMASFFGIWIAVWAILYFVITFMQPKSGAVMAGIAVVVVTAACFLYLRLNDSPWQSSRQIAIGLGGGMGLVMMLNVWGVIWRAQKRIIGWTKDNAANGTPIPPESAKLARQAFLASRTNAWLSLPMLLLMAVASHHPLFGR